MEVKKEGVMLAKSSFIFEKEGVLNPAKKGGVILLICFI
jgi:hypothetical protein